ncbi:Zinc finger protein glis2 [Chamberlinius hualienensis]
MDAEKEHEYYDQNEKTEIKCLWNNCNQIFITLEKLANHVNDDHVKTEKEGNFCCRWEGCTRKGRSFNARYKMLIHVRTHTNEKPHICRLCEKSFSRLENLKIHTRSHTGEKPYTCPVEGCDKAYSNSSDRFKHTRTHFVDKPYFCKKDGCNKRYTDPSSLRKHMKTYGHYRDERTCILPTKSTNKMCTDLVCNPKGNSETSALVKIPIIGNSSHNRITNSTLSVSPVLSVNVPSLITNPVFTSDSLKQSNDKFNQYILVQSGRLIAAVCNDIQRNSEMCPLDLTTGHQESSREINICLSRDKVFTTELDLSSE